MSLDHAPRPALAVTAAAVWRRGVNIVWSLEHAFERARAADRPVDDAKIRIFLVLSLFALAFAFVGVDAARKALGPHPGAGEFAPPAPAVERADLVDRDGRLLAVDLAHFGLYVDPREVWDTAETRRALRRALPNLPVERLDRALKGRRREYLLGSLSPTEKDAVHDLGLPGVSFEEESRRVYPLGASAAHLIGFSDAGGRGLAGAERARAGPIQEAATGGGDVALAVDLRVQAALEQELRRGLAEFSAKGAVGVVTDVQTGEILALSSLPDFDPNAPGRADPYALANHAAASVYEMGSTFKMFTFAAALDGGTSTMASAYDASELHIGPRVIHDFHAARRMLTLREIFVLSSNIGTAKMALAAGAGHMSDYFGRFGMLAPAKVDLAESARPITPRAWDESTIASVAFGNAIAVSPLNVAAATGALANGGELIPLTIRKRSPGVAAPRTRILKPETSQAMLDLLRGNVVDEHGSGHKADAPGLRVGGKTGSNEKAGVGGYQRKKLFTSFAGVFPTDGPLNAKRYLVLILMDEPQATPATFGFATAGWNSTVVAGRVIDRIAPFVHVARAATTPFAGAPKPAGAPHEEETTGAPL